MHGSPNVVRCLASKTVKDHREIFGDPADYARGFYDSPTPSEVRA
jgi:hypothetical protein